MKFLWKSYITGFGILITAILVNLIATHLEISTWYSFLKNIGQEGFSGALNNPEICSFIFLFMVYPLVLGYISWLIIKKILEKW